MIKKLFLICTMLLLSFSLIVANEDTIVGEVADFDNYISSVNNELLDENIAKPSFLDLLLGGQSFNFVDISTGQADSPFQQSSLCTLDKSYGAFQYTKGTSTYSAGRNCLNNQFIVFKSNGGDIASGTHLFSQLWLTKSNSDIPNFKNYWLSDNTFQYSYACYDCAISVTDDFEKGCLSKDKKECVSKSSSSCDIDYVYQQTCEQKIVETTENNNEQPIGKSVDIKGVELQKTEFEVGEIIYIRGFAQINKNVNGAVIETSLEYPNYVDFTPLSISETSGVNSGVCGDDITTGVKFSSTSNEMVGFTLRLEAKKTGTYNIDVVSSEGCGSAIVDRFDVPTFTIKESETKEQNDDPSQDGTVDETDEPINVNDGFVIDWSDIVNEEPDENQVDIITNVPSTIDIEDYFDYKDNPKTAYSLSILIALMIFLAVYIYLNRK
jgi:hypothetical protein